MLPTGLGRALSSHGCSHAVGVNQPKQQGSTVQLLNIISSPVPLRACGAKRVYLLLEKSS